MRNMARSINVLKDHVSAVLDLEYSPTGEEIVTGGYDKTLRIFKAREGHSRDVYHTKRMQKIWCVRYTMDGSRVLSASDDGNIRVWKNNSHDKLATVSHLFPLICFSLCLSLSLSLSLSLFSLSSRRDVKLLPETIRKN